MNHSIRRCNCPSSQVTEQHGHDSSPANKDTGIRSLLFGRFNSDANDSYGDVPPNREDCLDRGSDNLRVADAMGIALCSRVGRVFVLQSAASQPMRSTSCKRFTDEIGHREHNSRNQ